MKTVTKTIYPVARVMDAAKGLVEYVASDETLDSYREVIRVSGWRFDLFKRNAPFLDSHKYDSIGVQLGKVVDFKVDRLNGKPALVEVVQWAIDVPENELAKLGFRMTEKGYAKAVSVGFWPVKMVTSWSDDKSAYQAQLLELGLGGDNAPRVVYLEQQQVELSACVIGANPNALARAYKAGCLSDEDLVLLETQRNKISLPETDDEHAGSADDSADVDLALRQASLGLMATVVKLSKSF